MSYSDIIRDLEEAWHEYYYMNGHNLNSWYLNEIEKHFYIDRLKEMKNNEDSIKTILEDMGY